MTGGILTFLGGIGLFLFGMETMTDALRGLAGQRTRQVLARFTRTPLTGAIAGTVTTALLQSSSATTVTTVGFVGAGLLTFPQAIGVIFGANVGTTITGWMVMLIGFKLKIGSAALPLLFAGALLRILGRGRLERAGLVIAGFAMLFLGLEMMQLAMAGVQGQITPKDFPQDNLIGRLELVAIGAVLTAITQSSSAGVASTLVLITSGLITFTQGAALVIGMDIGTTVTAVLATIGGSRAMRQTGVAHVAYNVVTGALAVVLLGVISAPLHDGLAGGDDQLALVLFHTLFNLIGVILMLPLAPLFARAIERLVPERLGPLSEALDTRLLSDPRAALDAARACSRAISGALFDALGESLRPGGRTMALRDALARTEPAVVDLQDYLARIPVPPDMTDPQRRYGALLHQYDHLRRLQHRCYQVERIPPLMANPAMQRPAIVLGAVLRRSADETPERTERRLTGLQDHLVSRARRQRRQLLALGSSGTGRILLETDAMRWLTRVVDHVASIVHYDLQAGQEGPAAVRPDKGSAN